MGAESGCENCAGDTDANCAVVVGDEIYDSRYQETIRCNPDRCGDRCDRQSQSEWYKFCLEVVVLIVARLPVRALDGEWTAAGMEEQPRPVVLDPHCRARLPKLLHLVGEGQAKTPWIVCRDDNEKMDSEHIPLPLHDGRFSWTEILSTLHSRGIKSVMIEGGASVINDVLTQRIADIIIITIAPVFLGRDGVGIAPVLQEEWLHRTASRSIGKDIVLAGIMNP